MDGKLKQICTCEIGCLWIVKQNNDSMVPYCHCVLFIPSFHIDHIVMEGRDGCDVEVAEGTIDCSCCVNQSSNTKD